MKASIEVQMVKAKNFASNVVFIGKERSNDKAYLVSKRKSLGLLGIQATLRFTIAMLMCI